MVIEVIKVRKGGRPRSRNPKTDAEYQRERRERERELGIEELRGVRPSAAERAMIDALVALEGYGGRTELLMTLARREADRLGIDYRVVREDR